MTLASAIGNNFAGSGISRMSNGNQKVNGLAGVRCESASDAPENMVAPACDPLMTPQQCADWLGGVSAQWVVKQARAGRLPGLHIGREWRFSRKTILRRAK